MEVKGGDPGRVRGDGGDSPELVDAEAVVAEWARLGGREVLRDYRKRRILVSYVPLPSYLVLRGTTGQAGR